MRTTPIIVFLLFICCLPGCKKKVSSTVFTFPIPTKPTVNMANYFPMKVGNYWIYEHFTIDENDIFMKGNYTDSMYVEKDTVIFGKTFFKICKFFFGNPSTAYITYLDQNL